jgi:hypothetical protein
MSHDWWWWRPGRPVPGQRKRRGGCFASPVEANL